MDISVVIITYTILTIIGIASIVLDIQNKKRPILLSAFHAIFTLLGFGVFTFYLVSYMPQGVFTWPRISYVMFGIAGTLAFAVIVALKLLNMKLPKWATSSHAVFEILGYAALWLGALFVV